MPKLIYDECYDLWSSKYSNERTSGWYGMSSNLKNQLFNIYRSDRVYENTLGKGDYVNFN
jgi:hypothetical protein